MNVITMASLKLKAEWAFEFVIWKILEIVLILKMFGLKEYNLINRNNT